MTEAGPGRAEIATVAQRLAALGARELYTVDEEGEYSVTMADPEGNEFCLCGPRQSGGGTRIQATLACVDPQRVGEFWARLLGYVLDEPPDPAFTSWPEFLAAHGVPESEWNSAYAINDPAGVGPRIYLQRVPEPKAAKHRIHFDVNVGGGRDTSDDERRRRVADAVGRVAATGGSRGQEYDVTWGHWVVMVDPEGNEFCQQ